MSSQFPSNHHSIIFFSYPYDHITFQILLSSKIDQINDPKIYQNKLDSPYLDRLLIPEQVSVQNKLSKIILWFLIKLSQLGLITFIIKLTIEFSFKSLKLCSVFLHLQIKANFHAIYSVILQKFIFRTNSSKTGPPLLCLESDNI